MRLDKYLTQLQVGTRSEVKELLKKGCVSVEGEVVKSGALKIDELTALISCQGRRLTYQKFYYYMLNKPSGVVTATKDNLHKTVMDLCTDIYREDLFPVGRLDKDTEGLLLLTNDGELAHNLLSPKKHVEKMYYVRIVDSLTEEAVKILCQGVDIGEDKPTKPAMVKYGAEETECFITITEGKFHQVKRMLKAVGNEVAYLKRLSMGGLELDQSLRSGEYRELSAEEVQRLRGSTH